MFEQLPKELVHLILSYDGTIKYRHGMYMNQLSKTDPRYDVLHTIKRPNCCRYKISDSPVNYSYLAYVDFLFPNAHLYVDIVEIASNLFHNHVIYYIMSNGFIIHQYERTWYMKSTLVVGP